MDHQKFAIKCNQVESNRPSPLFQMLISHLKLQSILIFKFDRHRLKERVSNNEVDIIT